MAIYSTAARNTLAAALAGLLGGSRLFLISATGRTLAVLDVPELKSDSPGVLETVTLFKPEDVIASGDPQRYEIRQPSGLVILSGAAAELSINPPSLVEKGRIYIDKFVLTV